MSEVSRLIERYRTDVSFSERRREYDANVPYLGTVTLRHTVDMLTALDRDYGDHAHATAGAGKWPTELVERLTDFIPTQSPDLN